MVVLSKRVLIGSAEHILPIFLAFFILITFTQIVKKRNLLFKQNLIHYVAVLVSVTVISYQIYRVSLGNYNVATDLPLFLCSFIALIIPIFTYSRKYVLFEILLFWIIAGTTQAILTPDISEGYPSFDYFRYWIVHLGIVIIILYASIVLKMRPTFKSIFKSYFALQLFVIISILINYLLKSNYGYLSYKPKAATVLDYFGEWPYYIIVVQLIILPLFFLIYGVFFLISTKTTQTKS